MRRPNPDWRLPVNRASSLWFDWRVDYALRSPLSLDSLRQISTYARATAATGIDDAGVLYPVVSGQWRTTRWLNGSVYEPVLLLEPARTNGWSYSEDVSNAAWTKTNVTVTANNATAPDGTATADRIVETATASVAHSIDRTPATMTDNTAQAFSFFGKAGERSWFWLRTTNKANRLDVSYVNLSTGATGTVDANHTIRVTPLANGWYRVACVLDSSGTGATTPKIEVGITTADNTLSYTGSTSNGAYLWGLQHEADGGVETSYIPTTTAAVTRNADVITWSCDALPAALSLYVDFVELGTRTLNGTLVSLGADSNQTPRQMVYATGGVYKAQHHNGTASQDSGAPAGSLAVGTRCEVLATWNATGVGTLTWMPSGSAATTGTGSTAHAYGTAYGTAKLSVNRYNGATTDGIVGLRQIKVAAGVQTLATMQTLF